ncbi:MAG: glycoside hydrolase family 31 protein [Ignavibacteriae bacterium]|nr:glycoside hydrolase family 31 protein [Ignavibacteriota bacterium]
MLRIPLLLLVLAAYTSAQELVQPGRIVSAKQNGNTVELRCDNARATLTWYSDEIVRVRFARDAFDAERSSAVVLTSGRAISPHVEETDTSIRYSTAAITVEITRGTSRLRLLTPDGRVLTEDNAGFGVTWQGSDVTSHRTLFRDEHFLGMGEKTGPLDRRGRRFVNWNTDFPAYGIEQDPLYVSIPFFIGVHDSLAYGIFFDNTRKTVFDFGASSDGRFMSFSAPAGDLDYYVCAGPTVADVIRQYTTLTGRAPMPPRWALGYQQCRWSYYPESEVLNLARTFREKDIPCDVITLDIHYMDAYKIFTWHPDRFPDPKRLADSLHALGFRLVTIVDPGIKIEKGYPAYEEGLRDGHFVTYPDGTLYIGEVWPGRCHFPDFTNEKTRLWWGRSMRALTDAGVDGFWNDMNEPAAWGQNIPDVVRFGFNGLPASMREAHNVYGLGMARASYEGALKLRPNIRPYTLTRAAYAGVQRYSAVWTGDNLASDEHLMLSSRMVQGLGLSGVPFTGSDVGGFIGDPSPDLMTRWMNLGVFTPFFRAHKHYGGKSAEPWAFGRDAENTMRLLIRLRYRLLPYIEAAFRTHERTGLPVARSLAIEWSHDPMVYDWRFHSEYLFGDHLLVAPVPSTDRRADVYLPAGIWYRFGSDSLFLGGSIHTVTAPIADLPVFVRAGAIIPMRPVGRSTSDSIGDTLELHVWEGGAITAMVYREDDGISVAAPSASTLVEHNPASRSLSWGNTEGRGSFRARVVRLVQHGSNKEGSASVNGVSVPWTVSTPKQRSLTVPFTPQTTITWRD